MVWIMKCDRWIPTCFTFAFASTSTFAFTPAFDCCSFFERRLEMRYELNDPDNHWQCSTLGIVPSWNRSQFQSPHPLYHLKKGSIYGLRSSFVALIFEILCSVFEICTLSKGKKDMYLLQNPCWIEKKSRLFDAARKAMGFSFLYFSHAMPMPQTQNTLNCMLICRTPNRVLPQNACTPRKRTLTLKRHSIFPPIINSSHAEPVHRLFFPRYWPLTLTLPPPKPIS